MFDWERNVLEAVFEGAGLDLGSTPDLDPEDDSLRRVGGPAEHVQVGRQWHVALLMTQTLLSAPRSVPLCIVSDIVVGVRAALALE